MTSREIEDQCKIIKQKSLTKLSKQTEERISDILSPLKGQELPVVFNMRDFFREYCDISLSEDKRKLKIFNLLQQHTLCFSYLYKFKQIIHLLNRELKNQNEIERYILELYEKDMEISELKKRYKVKKRSLFWWKTIFFISCLVWLALFIYQNFRYEFDLFIL